ncbi:hypothetical protein [uncultured Hymenobacter sp.]|uniref:hypothetical protein n=1 Tax=uncultured Hymenobacter sp. TaxID=170016 RepID=UPI0035CA69D6
MKLYLLAAVLLIAPAAFAQTVPFDPSQPVRGGSQGQTTVAPLNPALNQSTIQGPPEIQRTPTNRDAQPSRLPADNGAAVPVATPDRSPTARPDIREQPLRPARQRRQSTDVVPGRNSSTGSSNVPQSNPPLPHQ